MTYVTKITFAHVWDVTSRSGDHSPIFLPGGVAVPTGATFIDNEGKNVIGCIYLMNISISNP
jgi:hypothetical protein